MNNFEKKVMEAQGSPLTASAVQILQVNLGYRCNSACKHCHIGAGPGRAELMDEGVMETVLEVLRERGIGILDITGGAPEMHPRFRYLVREARKGGAHVIVRTNLTVSFEEGLEDLPGFYHDNGVELVASLPHYTGTSVDRVRGNGTFAKSIGALRELNRRGYGTEGGRPLHLVFNPAGAFLPPSQAELELQFRKELCERHGVHFHRLFVFANMPIGRFREFLVRAGALASYRERVEGAFNPRTLGGLMCRSLVSVGWDGTLHDCDFNQVLGLSVEERCPRHIREFDGARLSGRRIVVDDHCFICTAGQGST
ncbi:MAG: arsenosugar biosynthesis radical SAM protein ArsS [Alphaproteobacteria bacterium]|uniref:Arsenosugar biosynthesis radical SAM protein ArsS n=1 Tax=Candidatus Nitrobium versatile TaxID=2884831 RepID=A0A953J225_9BACT|nr:arsenosugar biosynthesis radical SAM protein ArsS [Candidatus Nitrobium versatile]